MTIHQQNDPRLARVEQSNLDQQLHPASEPKKLSVNNPLIFFLILFGVLFSPDKLKAYRMRLNSTEKLQFTRQAARLTTTLIWLPLLLIFSIIWMGGIVKLNVETAVLMYAFSIVTWYGTYKFGTSNSVESQNNLLLTTMFTSFGLTAVLFTGIYTSTEHGDLAIMLILIAAVFSLISLAVAMVFKLKTLDIVAGFITLFIVGGISMTMTQVMASIWLPVIIILGAVLWVGITEERHDAYNHQQLKLKDKK